MGDAPRRYLIALILGVAIALRVGAMRGDLWLDEIWALTLCKSIIEWSDIILALHRDNNHHLTTLWMWLLGPHQIDVAYRIIPFAFSIVTLIGVMRLSAVWLRSSEDAWFRLLMLYLFGSSFLFVLYGTEARGYAGLIAAIVWTLVIGVRSEWGWGASISFVAWSTIGALSHPTFVLYLVPFACTTWCRPVSSGRRAARCSLALVSAALFSGVLYYLNWRHIPPGTGTRYGYLEVFIDALNSLVGSPPLTVTNPAVASTLLFSAILVLALLARGVRDVWRRDALEGSFLVGVLFVTPLAVVTLLSPRVLFLRYLLFALVPALYLLGYVIYGALCRGGVARVGGIAVLLLLTLGNGYHLTKLVTVGRGSYREPARYLYEHSPAGVVRYESDHPFRTSMVWDYYLPSMALAQYFVIEGKGCPEWYLTHTQDWLLPPGATIDHRCGASFDLVYTTESAPYSGWRWFIYRRHAYPAQ